MQRLGTVATELREFAEAESLLTAAAERWRTLPGHPVDGLVGCLANLAGLQWARGQRELAKSTLEQALERGRASLPAAHFLLSVSMTNLAYMLAELGDIERAIELLRDARQRATGAGRTREAAVQAERLRELLRRAGRDAEAGDPGGPGR
jgi:tetratricopeptide (TPR) repeat protein